MNQWYKVFWWLKLRIVCPAVFGLGDAEMFVITETNSNIKLVEIAFIFNSLSVKFLWI